MYPWSSASLQDETQLAIPIRSTLQRSDPYSLPTFVRKLVGSVGQIAVGLRGDRVDNLAKPCLRQPRLCQDFLQLLSCSPCPDLSAICSSSDSGARIVFSRSHLGFYYCRRLHFSLPVNCLGNTSVRLAALLSELIEFLQQILFERCARSTQLWHKTVPTRS